MFKSCIYELSTHPYGCRVLQRCFEHLDEDRARPLLDEVHKYAINLMQDQFGVSLVSCFLYKAHAENHLELRNAICPRKW